MLCRWGGKELCTRQKGDSKSIRYGVIFLFHCKDPLVPGEEIGTNDLGCFFNMKKPRKLRDNNVYLTEKFRKSRDNGGTVSEYISKYGLRYGMTPLT